MKSITILAGVILSAGLAQAQPAQLGGQLSGWSFFKESGFSDSEFGLRYIPTFSAQHALSGTKMLDAEVALNAVSAATFGAPDDLADDADVRTYRLFARLSASQFELRLGLQKINFGPAFLLRPLRWFDRLDPRDPLQITDGVYGLLARYYFVNNANIWLWGLYGNNDPKGLELLSTKKKSIEYGGRIQHPLVPGEVALTYHHRQADFQSQSALAALALPAANEDRLGLDGKWDIEIGIWFEGTITRLDAQLPTLVAQQAPPIRYRGTYTIGADYTLPLGNGLHVMAEHLHLALADNLFGNEQTANVGAFMADYSLGLLDRLAAIVVHDWASQSTFSYLSWGRAYDNWNFYLNTFWNPDDANAILLGGQQSGGLQGKGIQLIAVFNH